MFHKQPAAQVGEVLEINLQGSVRLARAAMAVMRPAGYGRIILVGSTGGLHSDAGLSAYTASKGGRGEPREYQVAADAFDDLVSGGAW
jgi:NAD(P)-dependent dehydrogenase (short-subunit alcohol dehydrogenase family)